MNEIQSIISDPLWPIKIGRMVSVVPKLTINLFGQEIMHKQAGYWICPRMRYLSSQTMWKRQHVLIPWVNNHS